jgi:hypothetical protein
MKRLTAVRGCRLGPAVFVAVCLLLSSCLRSPLRASDAGDDYARAVAAGKRKDYSAAFMHFRPLTERASPYREASLFAVGEYYVLKNVQADAIKALATLVREYPASRYRVFALWYLEMVAERIGRSDLAREYQQHIIMMRQHSFLFRQSKEWSVISPLQRKLKVVYYIDKVEFYVDGGPCAVLSY